MYKHCVQWLEPAQTCIRLAVCTACQVLGGCGTNMLGEGVQAYGPGIQMPTMFNARSWTSTSLISWLGYARERNASEPMNLSDCNQIVVGHGPKESNSWLVLGEEGAR